ncbi:MAG: hypothetical protein OEZ57_00450 [Nitrospirota bacterium]|nr:hypothetical protein [Nitrospirota bacterium]MDH5585153.1 hypothetical protein [Nitrospirota bacterium]MDH5773369.1 hypothetical protein [Nitrospirota bacterium]
MKTSVNLIVLCFLVAACSQAVDSEYSSLDAARKENAIRTGLLPEWLPESSRQISVAYDVGTNEKIVSFHYKSAEGWDPQELCKKIDPFDPPKPKIARPWWPEDVPATQASTPQLTFFACENGGSFLATNLKSGQAYYWNTKI